MHPTSTFQKGFKSTLFTFSAVFYTTSTTFQQKQLIERRLLPVDLHNRYLWLPRSREWRGGGGSAHSLRSALSRAQCEPARCPACALSPRNPASSGLRTGYAHHGSSPLQVAGQGRSSITLNTLVLSEFTFFLGTFGTLFFGSLEYKNTIFYNIHDCFRDSRQNFGPIPTKFGKILPLIKLCNGVINLKKSFE